MDENTNVTSNGTSTSTNTDYVIGGSSAPTEPVSSVAETTVTEPIPQPAEETSTVYEKANDAATNPTVESVEETPIYTTDSVSPMDSYSVPSTTTYASTDSTSSYNTYSGTVSDEAPVSSTLSVVSLVLGILTILTSCCCCASLITGIAGIICGVLQKPMEDGKKPGLATAGIITSAVGLAMYLLLCLIGFASGFSDAFSSYLS